jgi:hypothetical protein
MDQFRQEFVAKMLNNYCTFCTFRGSIMYLLLQSYLFKFRPENLAENNRAKNEDNLSKCMKYFSEVNFRIF